MKDLQEATERICELKGSLIALDALVTAMLRAMPAENRLDALTRFEWHAEVARTMLLHEPISDHTIAAFEHDVKRLQLLAATAPN